MNSPSRRLNILHIIINAGETNGQYNEHCLPMIDKRNISICTYFESELTPPPEITIFDGKGTIGGFFKALRTALQNRDYDAIHVHSPQTGFLFILANLFHGSIMQKSVYTVQNSYQNYRIRNRLMMYPIFAFYKRLVVCSHSALDSLPRFMRWLGGKRVHVVENAVDINRVDLVTNKKSFESKHRDFMVVSIGRIIKIKNPFSLLSAFAQSDDGRSRLVFLGEGDLRPVLLDAIKKQDLENRVEMTGLISRDEVFTHVMQSDLFVSTSYGEGLPVAVIEAMACRRPVVLSAIEPHREIAKGVDFIPLIDPDDIDGFAREIRRFREMPAAERREIGEKCRRVVEERFGLEAMHAKLEKVYAQLNEDTFPLETREVAG